MANKKNENKNKGEGITNKKIFSREHQKKRWDWINQARIVYEHFEIIPICDTTNRNFNVLDLKKKKRFSGFDFFNQNNYEKLENTVPIQTMCFGNFFKSKSEIWIENVKITYENKNLLKDKINLGSILFEIKVNTDLKELNGKVWTKPQFDLIYNKETRIDEMLKKPMNTVSKVDDFRYKALMNYFRFGKEITCICGEHLTIEHVLRSDCVIVDKLERKLCIDSKQRIDASFNYDYNMHTYA